MWHLSPAKIRALRVADSHQNGGEREDLYSGRRSDNLKRAFFHTTGRPAGGFSLRWESRRGKRIGDGQPRSERIAAQNVRLRPRLCIGTSYDVSIVAAETEYKTFRAESELKFREDLEIWWNEIDQLGCWNKLGQLEQPGLGSVDELSINLGFKSSALAYVEAEMENFAALLLNRRTLGAAGVSAIREHEKELIEAVREYHWRPLLGRLGLSDDDIEAAWISLDFR